MKFEDLKIVSNYQENEVIERNSIIKGDCLEIMKGIKDKSVDMILCDLPYETTKCSWDIIIPFDLLWEQYKRVIKDNGAIVLFGSQPFTSKLIMSNINMFRYSWVWDKVVSTGFLNANKMPLKGFEDICVFYKKIPTYNPQMEIGKPFKDNRDNVNNERELKEYLISKPKPKKQNNNGTRFPRGIIKFSSRDNKPLHPTQKPTTLLEYLIKTYTLERELILDNTAGSMSTAIASINTNRDFIMIEKDDKYFEIGIERIKNHLLNKIENIVSL